MVMDLARLWRHLNTGLRQVQRVFPQRTLDAVEAAVRASEARHPGQIRFVVEGCLAPSSLWRGKTPRQRAVEVFSELRVWDTEHNNGVLVYVLLADRDVEIVADRGVARGRVAADEWEQCCRIMEAQFRDGRFEAGAIAGVEAVAAVLARHPAGARDADNPLPDAPTVL
jgi:uncharacterized membrane protein